MSAKIAALMVCLATSGVTLGQVVVPPGPPPAETPKVEPPPLPQRPPTPPPPIPADLDYDPITPHDANGNPTELTTPQDYVALGHNVWFDARMLAKSASVLQARRIELEQLIVANLESVERLTTPAFQNLRVDRDDPAAGEMLQAVQQALAPFASLRPVQIELLDAGAIPSRVRDLHQKITNEYQSEVQKHIMDNAEGDKISAIVPFMMRTATAEILYFYDKLAVAVAEHATDTAWLREIALSDAEAARVREKLAAYESANADAQAMAAREVIGAMGLDARKRAMQKAMLDRPAPSATKIPGENVSFRPLATEERTEAVFGVVDGNAFQWEAFVTNAEGG